MRRLARLRYKDRLEDEEEANRLPSGNDEEAPRLRNGTAWASFPSARRHGAKRRSPATGTPGQPPSVPERGRTRARAHFSIGVNSGNDKCSGNELLLISEIEIKLQAGSFGAQYGSVLRGGPRLCDRLIKRIE